MVPICFVTWAEEQYREEKKKVTKEIKRSKKRSWAGLLKDLNEDVYGEGYKIVKKGLKMNEPAIVLTNEEEERIINNLFPEERESQWQKTANVECPPFVMQELKDAANTLKNKKAPGPDGIPSEGLKVAAQAIGDTMLETYNRLLAEGKFPKIWKRAKVVLIPKPDKNMDNGNRTYRPLCLIDTAGKLYERLILERLLVELDRTGGLSARQHGFRKGHSTMDAVNWLLQRARAAHRDHGRWCMLALIDVKNAFNTANWKKIVNALERREVQSYLINVLKDYLTDRTIVLKSGRERASNIGVPQGSVLGPTLWNVMYDDILRMDVEEGVTLIGYADDVAVLVEDKVWDRVLEKAKEATRRINVWLLEHGLQMAPQKTELVALKFGRRKREGTVEVAGQEVPIAQQARYLGVTIDTSVTFGPHIRAAAGKAERMVAALGRLMPNIGGPGEAKRRVLGAAVNSIMLCGAPIWADVMRVKTYKMSLQRVQRKIALRICKGYRTVSYEASTVIAGIIPIHLLAEERKRLWEDAEGVTNERRKAVRQDTLRKWQREWDAGEKGRWTRRVVERITEWVNRKHGQVDYFLTQWLTGHGSFKSYTKRIGKTENDRCEYCGGVDDPEHAVFACERWMEERERVNGELGVELTVGNVVRVMLRGKREWQLAKNFINGIMHIKEMEGRR